MNARQKRKYIRNFILGGRKEIEILLARILMGDVDNISMDKFWKRIRHAGLIEQQGRQATVTQKGLDLLARRLYP